MNVKHFLDIIKSTAKVPLRRGQIMMNKLYLHDKALYTKLTNSSVDPFYKDTNIPLFIDELIPYIEDEEC